MKWRTYLNRVNGGLACCAVGLVLAVLASATNSDVLAFQAARPCAPRESSADNCYAWMAGRVVAVAATKVEDATGPGRVDAVLTLDLPIGQRTVRVATTYLPPGKPHVGDTIDAKLWHGQITDIKVANVTVGSVYQPVTRLVLLAEIAVAVFLVGLLLLVAYAIDRRAGYAR